MHDSTGVGIKWLSLIESKRTSNSFIFSEFQSYSKIFTFSVKLLQKDDLFKCKRISVMSLLNLTNLTLAGSVTGYIGRENMLFGVNGDKFLSDISG